MEVTRASRGLSATAELPVKILSLSVISKEIIYVLLPKISSLHCEIWMLETATKLALIIQSNVNRTG